MYADFSYYKTKYYGIAIDNQNDFNYFASLASDYIKPYEAKIVDVNTNDAVKRCTCNIAETLYYKAKAGNGVKASESVGGVYSVNYNTNALDDAQIRTQINNSIKLYLGKYLCGIKLQVTY